MSRSFALVLALLSGCATVSERAAAGSAIGGGVLATLSGLAVGAGSVNAEGQIESRASVVLLGTGTVLMAAGVVVALMSDETADE